QMKKWIIPMITILGVQTMVSSCGNGDSAEQKNNVSAATPFDPEKIEAESFADLQVLRYEVPGFHELSLQQKQLAYYLYEAALAGRDIIYDQKSKYGLTLRKTLEAVYGSYKGNKDGDDWKKFTDYCGRFWFSNGNHHHYSNEKF